MRRLAAVLIILASCTEGPAFTPGSFVEKLRVLDIKATPAEIGPGEQTLLESLVVDPYSGVHPISYLWVMCDPDPSGTAASPCASTSDLRGLGDLTGADGGSLPDGVHIFPFGSAVYYAAPAGAFDTFPPGSPERENGVTSTILLVTWEGTSPNDLQSKDTVSQLALKRVRIVPPDGVRNQNPTIAEIRLNSEAIVDTSPPKLKGGTTVTLSATATAESPEKYVRTLPDGSSLQTTEPMVYSWYADAGSFDEASDQSARTNEGQGIQFHVPKFEDTANGLVNLWVVLRDDRGGSDFVSRKVIVDPR